MGDVRSLQDYRNAKDGDKYRLLQAAALLKLFWKEKGRDARDPDEFNEWEPASLPDGPVDPFDVLTEEEIAETLRGE